MKTIILHTLLLSLLLLAGLAHACSDDKDKPIAFSVGDPYEITSAAGYTDIEVLCPSAWEASIGFFDQGDLFWLSVEEGEKGTGNGTMRLRYDSNGGARRSALLSVTSGSRVSTVRITQQSFGEDIEFATPSLLFTSGELEELRSAVRTAPAGSSLKQAFDNLVGDCNSRLTYSTSANLDSDPNNFYSAAIAPLGYARDLALAYHLTDQGEYAVKAIEILAEWSRCVTVSYPRENTGTGMLLTRSIYPAVCAYDMLCNTQYMTDDAAEAIRNWFRSLEIPLKSAVGYWHENSYFNNQEFQNHVAAHTLGLMMIGYVLQDTDLVGYAMSSDENPRDFYNMLEGAIFMEGDQPCPREDRNYENWIAPRTGEIYDRYRHQTGEKLRGLQYSNLTMTILSITARICTNNGIDMFAYTAPTGENLRLCFDFYSDFYRLNDADIKDGYYSGESSRIGRAGDNHGIFELGWRYYPDSQPLLQFMEAANAGTNYDRATNYSTILGYFRFFSVPVDKNN